MTDGFLKPLQELAATALDGVASLFGNGHAALRDAPSDGTVTLPDDLFAKADVQTEWWYYTGHCETEDGRPFGFELVFFKRRTDLDRLGIVPVMALANPMYFAHFAISELDTKSFRYEHIRSFDRPLEIPVRMSETTCDIRLGDWSLREVAGKHILHATLNDGLIFDAILESEKPLVLNGDDGSGISRKKAGASNHFSFTRMSVSGQLAIGGKMERFGGSAWMDREFGIWEQTDWDWFSIQLDDGTELMIYHLRSESGGPTDDSTGTFVDRDGTCRSLSAADFELTATKIWTSPKTGAEYPAGWRITVPGLDIDVEVEPLIADQELDTRGTTMIVYWEGVCQVSGTRAGNVVTGRAYVELVGYDRSHENVNIATFLFADPIRRMQALF